eukprot:3218439-Pleurochrysis_carterae.AAC.1
MDAERHTLMHVACCHGHLQLAKWLWGKMDAKEEGEKKGGKEGDKEGGEGKDVAAEGGGEAATSEMRSGGRSPAEIDARDAQGRTPLHLACGSGHLEV